MAKSVPVLVASLALFASSVAAAPEATPSLLSLAREEFGTKNLTAAETKLFGAAQAGEIASVLTGDDQDNPDNASHWSDERVIHAERLAWLCTDPKAAALVTYHGIALEGMRVDGDLDLDNAEIKFPLVASQCVFTGSLNFMDARLRALYLPACRIKDLQAPRIEIATGVLLREGFRAEGEVNFAGASIGGDFDCSGAQLSNPRGRALRADDATIKGTVFLQEGFKAEGEVTFVGASIGGGLDCSGGQLSNPDGRALSADGATIERGVFLNNSFKAQGEVRLPGAGIGGNLDCRGAQFSNPKGTALNLEVAKIDGVVLLREGFETEGRVSFVSARVASHLEIKATLKSEKMILDLRSARAGTWWDDAQSWPAVGNLFLDGFSYERLQEYAPLDAKSRIEWLHRQPQDMFLPQPYEQLASVLLKMGHEEEAKKVMIQKNLDHGEHIARSYDGRPFLQRLARLRSNEWWWYNVTGKAIGYGYRPGRAFVASFVFILLGWMLFRGGYIHGIVAARDAKAYENDSHGRRAVMEIYPKFNAFIYSLESFLPLIKLDQSANWAPNANRPWGRFLRYYLYLHIVAGWVLTTLWVGAVTGLMKS